MSCFSSHASMGVGEVNFIGNIVAKNPMWHWTVNNYPSEYLNAKPSELRISEGAFLYKLHAQPFIAVSGYLPSSSMIDKLLGTYSTLGMEDKTSLTYDGKPIIDITDIGHGKVSFKILAKGTTLSGASQTGYLSIESFELRGMRMQMAPKLNSSLISETLMIFASSRTILPRASSSCFTGTGAFTSITDGVISGTSTQPIPGNEVSLTAFNQFVSALEQADAAGNAFRAKATRFDQVITNNSECNSASIVMTTTTFPAISNSIVPYYSAAHILELTPKELGFPEPATGRWHATLTVEAYQM